jgi:threonine dehydratase
MKPEQVAAEVEIAEKRIRPHVRETYLERSPLLDRPDVAGGEKGHAPLPREAAAEVYCKLENLQVTGSFKVRGALNKILSLDEARLARGVVTASTGNHGKGVAYGLGRVGAAGIVFTPETAARAKVEAIERLGAEVRRFGTDNMETEIHARRFAKERGMTFISPYNDSEVLAGQGTIAVELCRRLDDFDAVFVALGGGGLISGIAGYLRMARPGTRIIGCSPENSQVMIRSVKAGRILDLPSLSTLSDSTAGGLEPGAVTFPLCRDLVHEYVTVTEEEIRESLLRFMAGHHMLIEGAAAVAVAAYTKTAARFAGKKVVLLICGANIPLETLRRIL